ncbi:PRTRC system protein E [Cupriavidus basilensis]|uniref:PRTRC system protein E n=1 Tax=Cupriavidus basilensis TaxID=68895 RepID=UPI0020A61E85|nr:PRTRC system protein E [Cupriavidus basilensis]MCP3018213.1 PRTRC system protein E [Cupriavidus basilensis]
MSFFQEMATLVRTCEKVVLTITPQGDSLTVFVAPVVKNATDPALATPMVLTGTPLELDESFTAAMQSVVAARVELVDQIEATASILKAATAKQSNKATKALAKAGKAGGEASSEDGDGDGDDNGEANSTSSEVASTSTAAGDAVVPAAVAKPTGTNLADLI